MHYLKVADYSHHLFARRCKQDRDSFNIYIERHVKLNGNFLDLYGSIFPIKLQTCMRQLRPGPFKTIRVTVNGVTQSGFNNRSHLSVKLLQAGAYYSLFLHRFRFLHSNEPKQIFVQDNVCRLLIRHTSACTVCVHAIL